ncbi:uncharacterized protein [Miscanthus floridulus]|uniref:uncharacterized protein n=1 Tax=Miscanthus floridulus TaxID=154761 RepID=UPI00345B39F2
MADASPGTASNNSNAHLTSTEYLLKKYLLLLATLVATVTYGAELNLPGGSWLEDTREGQLAGDSILRETNFRRYIVFYCFNAISFAASLLLGLLLLVLQKEGSQEYLLLIMWNGEDENAKDKTPGNDTYGKLHEYIQLLATLAATIAYLAGLDPPGGVWANSGEGHSVGDPILLTTHPARYKVFFYFNSVAFVASLVIVVMLQKTSLVRSGHALLAALILDFFGLIGAYAAGSCRDTSTTIYTVAIAGAVLIYVVIHIVFFTLDNERNNEDELERKRELLMLLVVLAATLAYQAGLTPPGGLWEDDDKFGHHRAGFPVLQDKYPRRYKDFFYCNAASFMASVALIILLLNKNMYKPGIRCYALYVCMVAGMFGLIGAYAAGSSLHRRTSVVFLVLVAAGFGIVILLAILRYVQHRKKQERSNKDKKDQQSSNKDKDKDDDDADHMAYYLMLVGILAASITYLTGLKPPGGMWREDGDGHSAGNPVLYDINKRRYNVFFYSNSASLVASIIVIALILSRMMLPAADNIITRLRRVHTAIVLDVLALLVAYAAGSSRESRRSWKVIMLFPIEVLVVLLFCFISIIRKAYCLKQEASPSQTQTTPKT